jgi:hypothetical protein
MIQAGYVGLERMGEVIKSRQNLVSKSEENRQHWRTRRIWEDNTKMNG